MYSEANSVEAFVRDLLVGLPVRTGEVREPLPPYTTAIVAATGKGLGWTFVPGKDLPRAESEALVLPHIRDALLTLNPDTVGRRDRADEVIYRLRAVLLSVATDGLVRANEEFARWLRGERTMPFGSNNEHVPVQLLDLDRPSNNRFVVSTQVTFNAGVEKRFDLVLWVNGIPLVVGEAKTPTRPSVSWVDGAIQVHDDYEANCAPFFVPNLLSFATEGKTFRYGAIRQPVEDWFPWREENGHAAPAGLEEVRQAVTGLLRPDVLLDILEHFTVYATDKKRRKIKLLCRYQQYQATNQIVRRVTEGRIKKGLIWHFQGSGKSLLMVFAAQKLRRQPALKAPTVIIVVDRIDLDTQITATFNATDVQNVVPVESRARLQELLAADTRKVLITTIYKFGEADGVLNRRDNIILLVDEAHRTQEGDLGRTMRKALPNAFLFGLTGTPINKADRNTFWAFGAEEDEGGYMSRYSFEESIRDRATLPLHFEGRLVDLHIDKEAINEGFRAMTGHLSEADAAMLSKKAGTAGVFVKSTERVRGIVSDIVDHFTENVEPNGFKALVVTYDQESCVMYKEVLDEIISPDRSSVVISVGSGETDTRLLACKRDKDQEERLLDRFRDPKDPLQFLIVTARLLTGFDAPILQTMYLDKPLREHTLLQAITRVNRPYTGKSYGLIVDYIGIFDDVANALNFDDRAVLRVITNLSEIRTELPQRMAECLVFFPNVDRSLAGYEGLLAAQECLPADEIRDKFASAFSALSKLWEALSPDPCLQPHADDYRWLGQVYESVKPPSGNGKLVWHALGAKTVKLIHENIHLQGIRDDLETLVMNPELLETLEKGDDPKKRKEIEIVISARLRRHAGDPRFVELAQRLEEMKRRFEQSLMTSMEFLKSLLDLARDMLEAERTVDPVEEQDRAKSALTELFQDVRTNSTPIIVERIVNDIDEIVRSVRFAGWQDTLAGEREVKKALRRVLLKYKLQNEQELFDRAYAYIRRYYAI